MMKRFIIILVVNFIAEFSFAQDYFDVVSLTQNGTMGTARSMSMGNAFGALGGDFSSSSINPAGIGVYRSGEFTLTPSYTFANGNADYLGTKTTRNTDLFNISNIGYVVTNKNEGAGSGLVSFSFAIGYNRLKDFKANYRIIGDDAETSLLDYYTDYANYDVREGFDFNDHYEGLALDAKLVYGDPNLDVIEDYYINDFGDYSLSGVTEGYKNVQTGVLPHRQNKIIYTTGHINEFVLSFAGNIQHKTYIGATIGVQAVDYWQSSRFSEYDNNDESEYLEHYDQDEDIFITGAGVNLKVGFIHRVNRSLRLGVALHTPTWYGLTYESLKSIDAYYDDEVGSDDTGYDTNWVVDNLNTFSYQMKTPYKALFSVAYQYGTKLSVDVDYELINYGNTKFNDYPYDSFDYSEKNFDNRNYLASSSNIRGGIELKLTSALSLRGGYEYFGNPWKSSYNNYQIVNHNDVYSVASCGFGYRSSGYFIDFSLSKMYSREKHAVHQIPNIETSAYYSENPIKHISTITQNRLRASFTLGLKF